MTSTDDENTYIALDLPWQIDCDGPDCAILDCNEEVVAAPTAGRRKADFSVLAANSHHAMKEALEACAALLHDKPEHHDALMKARAALRLGKEI